MAENLLTLLMLILLQAVLGFDNLLYISLESKRVPAESQKKVRLIGITIAMVLRIGLLFFITILIKAVEKPFLTLPEGWVVHGDFNLHSVIVLIGGGFIIYTAIKEIWHMMTLELNDDKDTKPASVGKAIVMIVVMNLVFSFDSILSAIALTDVFWVMAVAIVASGILMLVLAGKVSEFLQKNRMYEVLGLFVLFLVGVMLITEGGELAHLEFFGTEITHMNKTTFYFILFILVIVDVIQGRYQKNLEKIRASEEAEKEAMEDQLEEQTES